MAVAGLSLRREAPGVRGRVRDAYFHDSPSFAGAQGGAGLRAGAEEPGQEPDAHSRDHARRGDGPTSGADHRGVSTDSRVFESYVESFLAPTLTKGQEVVVMDKLSAHRTERVRELIEARGAELVFLPSYSPDLNPIEESL